MRFLFLSLFLLYFIHAEQPEMHRGYLGYGFTPSNLYTQKFSDKSYMISTWPHRRMSGWSNDITIGIAQNLLNNLLTKDLVHLVSDKISGYALPVEEIRTVPLSLPASEETWFGQRMGSFEVVLTNFRIHKIRITKFKSPDPEKMFVKHDVYGGKLEDLRTKKFFEKPLANVLNARKKKAHEEWAFKYQDRLKKLKDQMKNMGEMVGEPEAPPPGPTTGAHHTEDAGEDPGDDGPDANYKTSHDDTAQLLFLGSDRLHVSIKGLNVILTADYTVRGLSGWLSKLYLKGRLYTRALNSVAIFDLLPTADKVTGEPTIKVMSPPALYLDEVTARFDHSENAGNNNLLSSMSKKVIDHFSKSFPIITSQLLMEHLPTLTKNIFSALNTRLISASNEFMNQKKLPPLGWPYVALEDMRWTVKDYQLLIGLNLRHIKPYERNAMKAERDKWHQEHPMFDESKARVGDKPPTFVKIRYSCFDNYFGHKYCPARPQYETTNVGEPEPKKAETKK